MSVPLSSLGPSVVVFHETQHTELLGEGGQRGPPHSLTHLPPTTGSGPTTVRDSQLVSAQEGGVVIGTECTITASGGSTEVVAAMSAEELLRIRFAELGRIPKAFSSVEYVGTRTPCPPTDFSVLQRSVLQLLLNNAVRAPKSPGIVLRALQVSGIKCMYCILQPLY